MKKLIVFFDGVIVGLVLAFLTMVLCVCLGVLV